MPQDFTTPCSSAVATLQDDGRVLINGNYVAKAEYLSAVGAYSGEPASPRGVAQYADLIWKYSNQYGVPAALMAGIMAQESHGQLNAMNYGDNPHGAGLMQVTMTAAKQGYTDYDIAHDAEVAIMLGISWFHQTCWLPHSGNYVAAVASYNAGNVHCGTLSGHTPNEWNLKTYGDYVTPVLEFQNGFIDSGTFDPQNNPQNAPPSGGGYTPPDGSGGGGGPQDIVQAAPASSGGLWLGVLAMGALFAGAFYFGGGRVR
jgi:hypothetical protein